MNLRRTIKSLLRKAGYAVEKYSVSKDQMALRMLLLMSRGINVVFDIGANEGQFAHAMRLHGYKGRIVSFEPIAKVYEKLLSNTKDDTLWQAVNYGIGSFDGHARINVAMNSASSSMLDMLPRHLNAAPESEYVGQEEISVRRVDSVIDDYIAVDDRLYVKIDTQGFEKHVIEGAEESLNRICGMQLEMSLVPLYDGEMLIGDMINLLRDKGYTLVAIEPSFRDRATLELLQVDGIFFRKQSN
jgi:FkbM family methyltransferase